MTITTQIRTINNEDKGRTYIDVGLLGIELGDLEPSLPTERPLVLRWVLARPDTFRSLSVWGATPEAETKG